MAKPPRKTVLFLDTAGHIEIQGDHRDRLVAELEKLGNKVKRAGG